MKKTNDYYKERELMSPDEYYNKAEELLSNGKVKEYNDFIQHTPLTFIDLLFSTEDTKVEPKETPIPPDNIDIVI